MLVEQLVESQMTFIAPPMGWIFAIEKSELVARLGKGVKIAEFVSHEPSTQEPVIRIVEAKSSFLYPEPSAEAARLQLEAAQPGRVQETPETRRGRFEEQVQEIVDKFANTFSIFISLCIKRNRLESLEAHLTGLDLSKLRFSLILVVKNHKSVELVPLQEKLAMALQRARLPKLWCLPAPFVKVLNEQKARELKLIV